MHITEVAQRRQRQTADCCSSRTFGAAQSLQTRRESSAGVIQTSRVLHPPNSLLPRALSSSQRQLFQADSGRRCHEEPLETEPPLQDCVGPHLVAWRWFYGPPYQNFAAFASTRTVGPLVNHSNRRPGHIKVMDSVARKCIWNPLWGLSPALCPLIADLSHHRKKDCGKT